jgi:hypothetical protein
MCNLAGDAQLSGAQRESEGLRAFAQSLSTDGLGVINASAE